MQQENSSKNTPDVIIGIDLGTTNSLVAYADETGPIIIEDDTEGPSLPSVVRIDPSDQQNHVVGALARQHAVEFPDSTIYSVKRLMGRGIDAVKNELAHLAYQVVEGENNTARVQVDQRIYSAPEISAIILRQLKQRAEKHFGHEVTKAVVTVPAYFDDAQRQATRDAGRIAGLEVLRIVNEPTAAALAYNLDRNEQSTIAVYDFGGGTFDVSILKIANGVFKVISTAGDTHLGGDDIDRSFIELIQSEIRAQFGSEINFPPATRQAFRNLAEAAKIRLSTEEQATLEIDLGADRTYHRTITRHELEDLALPHVNKTIELCKRTLRDAKLTPENIDQVVMVGGSTRMPLVRRIVGEYFDCEPYTALNPDQVVALGAAVQAAVMAGINREALLLDVIPLSLGIETLGGAVAKIIIRNSQVPAIATEGFSTHVDGQTSVKINVYQGERELVQDCRLLGEFELKGIPPMPAGLPKIKVTFIVDANGILTVQAVEERSEKRAEIQVVPNHGLSRDEVNKMETDSYAHAREDMLAHRLISLRNQATMDIRQIEKQLEKVGNEIDIDYRATITEKMTILKAFLEDKSPDPEAFSKALTDMDHTTVKLAETAISKTLREEGIQPKT